MSANKQKAITNKPSTLCWSCANACGGCSWSDGSFTPVDGWTAKKTELQADRGEYRDKIVQSYLVKKCPKYENDKDKYKFDFREVLWY